MESYASPLLLLVPNNKNTNEVTEPRS